MKKTKKTVTRKVTHGDSTPDDSPASRFPIVAIGASAGGLDALRQLFSRLPSESGLALVVIQHLDPQRPSMLAKVLKQATSLAAVQATDGMPLEPGRIHVIPADADLTIENRILKLVPWHKTGRLHLPVDSFFRSLAADEKDQAIGIVLSGSGADGTEGLRAIKGEGGIAIAQEPESAQFPNMPQSAIDAGVVDFRGTPELIADELLRLSRHPFVGYSEGHREKALEMGGEQEKFLAEIFNTLRQRARVDFGGYKRTTVLRRIQRRMALKRATSLEEYVKTLQDDPAEAQTLARDMLIVVTSFFRDSDAFDALKEQVLRELVQGKGPDDTIRIWVPGCATGEEAYGIIICLLEVLEGAEADVSIKLFGTDLCEDAIETARLGIYPETALEGVSAERLSRFFEQSDRGYQVARKVRDLCVFVKHDLTCDPPFARLDLISCRNLLIYFDAELQRRVIPMLHYCLNPGGFLFLGQSEMITGFRDLFATLDQKRRIFVKTGDNLRFAYPLPAGREAEVKLAENRPPERRQRAFEAQRQADHVLLTRYAPPGVIVNDRLEIVQFRGRTGTFLEPAPGQPQANILRMARSGLAPHIHHAIEQAKADAGPVKMEGLQIEHGSDRRVDLEVLPLAAGPNAKNTYFLILFEERDSQEPGSRAGNAEPSPMKGADAEVARLKAELLATRDYLQSLISENQSTTDELAAANEELVAGNEELQSTNEELQSAKEEMQSTNEELSTVNDQLRHRNLELDEVADDLSNVLASVDIPVIIVDKNLLVRRFTPTVKKIASFIPDDVGRSINDLRLRVKTNDLAAQISEVLNGHGLKESEVQGEDGYWFRLQIRPYRTSDGRFDGAVLSFIDVDALKHAVQDAEVARDYARSIVETVTAALVVLGPDLRLISANKAFYEMFATSADCAEGRQLPELGGGHWAVRELRQALEDALNKRKKFTGLELATELRHSGYKILSFSGRPIPQGENVNMALVTIDDVTELRLLEAERSNLLESEKQARLEAERATRAKDLFLATLSHELRTPLSTMLMSAQLLRQVAGNDARIERASASIERAVKSQSRLIDDLLDVSRIVSGKLLLDLSAVDISAVVREAVDLVRPAAQSRSLDLDCIVDEPIGSVYGDSSRLLQVVNNLLNNSIKFTPSGGHISVHLKRLDGQAEITVTDTGMGIPPEVVPQLFSRFVQADSTVTRTHGGLGLGLSIVRHLVEAHGGKVEAQSPGKGKGSTFRLTLPLGARGTMVELPQKAMAYGIANVRILLVEDDDDTREVYAAMLTELGAKVRAEPSAAAGLAAVDEFRPQVIVSDIAMPGEDGFSFIRKLRRRKPNKGGHIPAAALTALASEEDRQRAIMAGFQVHIAKPIDAVYLASVIRRLVDESVLPEKSSPHKARP